MVTVGRHTRGIFVVSFGTAVGRHICDPWLSCEGCCSHVFYVGDGASPLQLPAVLRERDGRIFFRDVGINKLLVSVGEVIGGEVHGGVGQGLATWPT